ncbi:hypothetical protein H2200_006198 [Cladophialophora chaetospira]|uniref:Uncharacterized protein n=1 Tax=Cladophialophora chaetospira TaxID=386627 RepID=A0AA39CIW1_9EURO|nr:hypothetical protein H2200_006198 [Cladophialophora chaetospira]
MSVKATSFPTPNDLSTTVIPNWLEPPSTVLGRQSNNQAPKSEARAKLAVKATSSEFVLAMLYIWNNGTLPKIHDLYNFDFVDEWVTEFGDCKVQWQKIEGRMESYDVDEIEVDAEIPA